jgi:signal transduction histidine kinase
MEPYSDQLNVTRLNFSDRDWYKGVMSTMTTYVSDVYESTTLKRNVVVIRAPVFDDSNNLIGIWGSSLDLKFLQDVTKMLILEKNAKVLEKLINDIMDARKLDINKMKFKFEDVSPTTFFEGISSSYSKTLQERGIEFTTKLDLKDVTINVDGSRLRQVFDNLIGNAIKFVPSKGGKIKVGGDKKDRDVILYVKDNGIGIPPEKQGDLFKKFYQIDTSERRIPGGAGLGLAIARGIMENMNGSIWVQSDGKSGTTFYLKLPQK